MPRDILQAHKKLDRLVDKCYRSKPFRSDLERLEFLFDLYGKYVNSGQQKIENTIKKKIIEDSLK